MWYDDDTKTTFFFDPETDLELRNHPHHNAIVAAIGEREGDKVTETGVRPKASRSVGPYSWNRRPQRLTGADFDGRPVKAKVWSPHKHFRETIYLVPDAP